MTAVLHLTGEGRAPVILTAIGARRLTDEIRHHLGSALVKLADARNGHAHLALGYPSWWQYVESEFGAIRELRLPVPERQALVASMTDDDLTVDQIQAKIGFSRGTIHADRVATGRSVKLHAVPAPEPEPIGHLPKRDQVVILIGRQGDRGMTCLEIELETGWRHGVASSPVSACARQGRIRATGRFRAGYGVYVVVEDDDRD
jgi:hypothetical protein